MTDFGVDLNLPPSLSAERRDVLLDVARRNDEEHGENFLGMVLSGSAGRGMATPKSDVDVYVILTDEGGAGRDTAHSATVDEIPYTLSDLAVVAPFHSGEWWFRWSFAWAPVLLDRTGGRLSSLMPTKGELDPTRSQLATRAQLAGIRLEPDVEVETPRTAIELVAAGFGATILCRTVALSLQVPSEIHCVEFDDPMYETLAFIKKRDQSLSSAAREMVRFAHETLLARAKSSHLPSRCSCLRRRSSSSSADAAR